MLDEALTPFALSLFRLYLFYLEDLLIFAEKEGLTQKTGTVIAFLSSLGWLINNEKSSLVTELQVSTHIPPEEKIQRVMTAVRELQSLVLLSLRHYMY